MSAKIYEFPLPLDEIEKAGGCTLRWWPMVVPDPRPPPDGGNTR